MIERLKEFGGGTRVGLRFEMRVGAAIVSRDSGFRRNDRGESLVEEIAMVGFGSLAMRPAGRYGGQSLKPQLFTSGA